MRTKLTKSQTSLYRSWTEDYQRIMAVVGTVLNDNLNLRLEKIAAELGIDVEDGRWNFDQNTLEFWKSEEKEKPVPEGSFPGEPEADNVEVPVGDPEKSDVVNPETKE